MEVLSDPLLVRKAVPCVVRAGKAGNELLVLEVPGSGIRIPKGLVSAGEDHIDAARRELERETGVTDVSADGVLGQWLRRNGDTPEEWTVVRFTPTIDLDARWVHWGDVGGAARPGSKCRWMTLGPETAEQLHPLFGPTLALLIDS